MYPRLRQAGRFDLERVLCRENMGVSIAMSMGFKRLIQVQYYGKPPSHHCAGNPMYLASTVGIFGHRKHCCLGVALALAH